MNEKKERTKKKEQWKSETCCQLPTLLTKSLASVKEDSIFKVKEGPLLVSADKIKKFVTDNLGNEYVTGFVKTSLEPIL